MSSLPLGDILAFQKESYDLFLNKNLRSLFDEFFPIVDSNERFRINFVSHRLEEPRLSPREAKERFTSYTVPFKVNLQLQNTITGVTKDEEVLLGDIPVMTPQSSFIINGVERTIVSQLVRSYGVRFFDRVRGRSRRTFGAQDSAAERPGRVGGI